MITASNSAKRNIALVVSLIVLTALPDSGFSETTPGGSEEQERTPRSALMEEVVVTATKRAVGKFAYDTPVSVSAFNRDQFKAVFAKDLRDLSALVPNVVFKETSLASIANFTVRGMGVTGSVPSDAPAVGLFQNGVFWATNYGASLETFDIESVEVLRGPQGTLFGRNVTGGAVLMQTKRPDGTFDIEAEMVQGSHGRQDYSFSIQGSLLDGLIDGRFVYLDRGFDGYFDNLAKGGEDYGGKDTELGRGTLVFSPVENLEATLILERYSEDGDNLPVKAREIPGTLPFNEGFRRPADFWDTFADEPGFTDGETNSVTLQIDWTLPHGVITSITGYRDVDVFQFNDQDGSASAGFHHAIGFEQDQFSQELRYASTYSERMEFTAGLYYFQQDHDYQEARDIFNHAIVFASGNSQEVESYAVFGEAEFMFADDWSVIAGGRFTDETVDARTVPFGTCQLDQSITDPTRRIQSIPVPCDLGPEDSVDFSDFSPKIGLNWRPMDGHLVYGSVTRGFRSGGFTLRGSALTPPFDAEEVTAFEVGYKGDLLNDRLRLSLAAYSNDFDDLQRTVVFSSATQGSLQITQNAAKATVQGVEAEVLWQALDNLLFTFTYGRTDPDYDEFRGLDVTGDGVPDPELAEDLDFVRVPGETYSCSVVYDQRLGDAGDITWRVAGNKTGSLFFDDPNTINEDSYTLWNASITYTSPSRRWELALFGKNLTEEEYCNWGANLGALGQIEYCGAARRGGLRATFKLD